MQSGLWTCSLQYNVHQCGQYAKKRAVDDTMRGIIGET